jgi:2-haloacid dehalogenase
MGRVGVGQPGEIAFVSSNRWDVAGAAAFGFVPVWVNRTGMPNEYPGADPVATLPDLSGLAPTLAG